MCMRQIPRLLGVPYYNTPRLNTDMVHVFWIHLFEFIFLSNYSNTKIINLFYIELILKHVCSKPFEWAEIQPIAYAMMSHSNDWPISVLKFRFLEIRTSGKLYREKRRASKSTEIIDKIGIILSLLFLNWTVPSISGIILWSL